MKRRMLALCLLIVLVAPVMLLTQFNYEASAQTKPSVPEFSLKIVAYPYDVAPTTTIDPYTGKIITNSYGYHAENKSFEVTIKNQPFTSTLDASGNYTNLYYNIQFKGHYGKEWSYAYSYYNASNSEYTVVSIGFEHQDISFPAGGQIDFQVRALIGHQNKFRYDTMAPLPDEMLYYYEFAGQTGDWSPTQTIVIPLQISVLSPKAENYTVSDVPLNFTVDNEVSQIAYSLDGKDNVTISGSTTLTGLPNGLHNVTVYANDTFGNMGMSETISFTVAVPEPFPESEPFPTTIVAVASVVSVVLVGIGLLVYFKKRKGRRNP